MVSKSSTFVVSMTLNAVMVLLLYFGYILTTGLEIIESPLAKILLRVAAALLACVNIWLKGSIKFGIFWSISALLVLIVINQNIVAGNLLFLLIMLASAQRVDQKSMAVILVLPGVLTVLLHGAALSLGLVESVSSEIGERTRSALGFANPNQAAIIYLSLVFSILFLHVQFKRKITLVMVLASLFVAVPVLEVTGSRTSMMSLVLLVTFMAIWPALSRISSAKSLFVGVAVCMPVLASALTFYLASNSSPLLNLLLSLRPYYFEEFLKTTSWLDILVGWKLEAGIEVDNAYLMLLSSIGAPLFAFVIVSVSFLIKNTRLDMLPIAIVILIASVFESTLVRPELPIALLFLFIVFSREPERNHPPIGALN